MKTTSKKARKTNEAQYVDALTDDEVNSMYEKYSHQAFEEARNCLHSYGIKTYLDICFAE